MGRLKALLVLLLTFAVLVAGLFLPAAVSALADRAGAGQIYREPVQSVELELLLDEQRTSTDLLEFLSWYSAGYTYPIPEERASMTKDQVEKAVAEELGRYSEAGIYSDIGFFYNDVTTYIMVNPENPEDYRVFWNVSFVKEEKPYESVVLHIDDVTGKILYISYDVYGTFDKETAFDDGRALLKKVTDVYFTGLGLTGLGYQEIQKGGNEKVSVTEKQLDGGVLCLEYVFRDSAYGEFRMEFYSTGVGGFYVWFPG